MLALMRKKGFAKKVIWAVAIVIIISFGFFGTAYLLTGTSRNSYPPRVDAPLAGHYTEISFSREGAQL